MKILLVEDDPSSRQIVCDILGKDVYEIRACGDGDRGVELIEEQEWDLVILDIMLPGKDGFHLLKKVKELYRFTPVLMFTVLQERNNIIKAYRSGADDFINKPFNRWEFLARVRSLLKLRESYMQLEETRNVVVSLAQAVEAKDPYTRGHSERVGKYSSRIAAELGFSEEKCRNLYWAGILHDVGKIKIPGKILTKAGKLTDEEYEKVKHHPGISHKICSGLRTLQEALPAIKYHHERWDGKGYPEGLKGKDIPAEARIMAVADAFDAMTSDRSYRKAMPPEKVAGILKQGRDKQWQGSVVDAMLSVMEKDKKV